LPFFRWSNATTAPKEVSLYATDPSMVEAARRGDREAFGKLFMQYAPMIHGILLTRVSPQEASDLVQEVFLSALERLSSLRDNSAFGGWITMIARNKSVDFYKARKHFEVLPEELSTKDPDRAEVYQILRTIKSLPEAYHETLILRLVEGMTGPEIAERTGLTPDSVRVNLHRGMNLLKEKLRETK
jgi:RNA polymerase sigma-70 factor, ECF subfamily